MAKTRRVELADEARAQGCVIGTCHESTSHVLIYRINSVQTHWHVLVNGHQTCVSSKGNSEPMGSGKEGLILLPKGHETSSAEV